MMGMDEYVRYYLLAVPVRGYNFNKTCYIVNKGI